MSTLKEDFKFNPQTAQDHIHGYFEENLVLGAFADVPDDLKADAGKGETITWPFYNRISGAEDLTQTDVLSVDKLTDDSFTATVKEVGKAVGFKDAALIKHGNSTGNTYEEATKQIGEVMAEKVDEDLMTELVKADSSVLGFNAAAAADVCNIQNILRGKVTAFGDKQSKAQVIVLHSQHIITFGVELFNKMLIKDANDPYAKVPGFMGRILDMAVVVTDRLPRGADVGGKQVFPAFSFKANPYGYVIKKEGNMETDRDILARETVMAFTQWYAVKSYHAKISAKDLRVARMNFATELSA